MSRKLFGFMCREFDVIVVGVTSGDPEERWADYSKRYSLNSSLNTMRWLEIPEVLDAQWIESGVHKAMDDAGYHRMQFGKSRPHDVFMLKGRTFVEAWELAENKAKLLIRFKMKTDRSETPNLAEALRKAQAEAEYYRRGKWASDQKAMNAVREAEEARRKFEEAQREAEAATLAKQTAEREGQRARWDLEAIQRELELYKRAEQARADMEAAERAAKEHATRRMREAKEARFRRWFWGTAAATGLLIYLVSNHSVHIQKPAPAVASSVPSLPRKAYDVDQLVNSIVANAHTNGQSRGAVISANTLESVRNKIRPCWDTTHLQGNDAPVVTLVVQMNEDGTPIKAEVEGTSRYNTDPVFRAAANTAWRAVMNPRCQPWPLPRESYNTWRTITFHFDSRDF